MAGLDAGLVAFGVMGLAADDPDLVRVCYAAMGLLSGVFLTPSQRAPGHRCHPLAGHAAGMLRYWGVAVKFVVVKPWSGRLVVGRLRRESGGIRR